MSSGLADNKGDNSLSPKQMKEAPYVRLSFLLSVQAIAALDDTPYLFLTRILERGGREREKKKMMMDGMDLTCHLLHL